jgi:hypothetical protein
VQRFGTTAVAGADVGASRNQVTRNLDVVRERRSVQGGIAFIDLHVTRGDEEFVSARQGVRRQQRRTVKRHRNDRVIAHRDCYQQAGKVVAVAHASR